MTSDTDVDPVDDPNDPTGGPDGVARYSVDGDDLADRIEAAAPPAPGDAELSDAPFRAGFPRVNSEIPELPLPTFGTPDDTCGDMIPPARHFCPECGTVEQKPHVCYRYRCPDHGLLAVRRRSAGSDDAAGVVPKLYALAKWLGACRGEPHHFQHLVFSPPDWWEFEADDALERLFDLVRELMDHLGVQGVAALHPYRGEGESHDDGDDDMGKWKDRLGPDSEWDAVRDDLEYSPHVHVIGVAPFVDTSDVGTVYERTGWTIRRILRNDDPDDNVSIEDLEGAARRVTYALSHAGVYQTDGGQHRLAARLLGPDVTKVSPQPDDKAHSKALTYQVSQRTLGVAPPDLECDTSLEEIESAVDDVDEWAGSDDLPELPHDETRELLAAWDTDVGATGTAGSGGPLIHSARAGVDAAAGFGGRAVELPEPADVDAGSTSGSRSTTRRRVDHEASDDADGDDQEADDDVERCGGDLRHISLAGEWLLDGDVREGLPFVDELEREYRLYKNYMRDRDLDLDDRPDVPEHGGVQHFAGDAPGPPG